MPFFLQQASFTHEAIAKLLANPQDRIEAVRGPIEKLGGRIHASFIAFGEYDVVSILEMPDNISAAALAMGVLHGAEIFREPVSNDYGGEYAMDRSYGARDPDGHLWFFMQRLRNPPGDGA